MNKNKDSNFISQGDIKNNGTKMNEDLTAEVNQIVLNIRKLSYISQIRAESYIQGLLAAENS